jgi:hypothetical protein
MSMDVLLTDICARALTIELAAENTDDGILEILDEHQDDLIEMGLTHDWIQENGWSDIPYIVHQWNKNVRIFDWWACYSMYESDDQIVTAFLVDSRRTGVENTLIFLAESGEYKVYQSDLHDIKEVLVDIQWQLAAKGFEWEVVDVQEAFSRRWLLSDFLAPDKIEKINDRVRRIQWAPGYDQNEWARLRCFVFSNKSV